MKIDTYKIVDKGDGTEDTTYFDSDYESQEELEAAGADVAERVHEEGSVLLKNNGVLPLASDAKVSTLSHSSIDFVTCGTGAADIDTSEAPTLKEALESRGVTVNPTLWDFYESGAGSEYIRYPGKLANQTEGAGGRMNFQVNEVPMSVYTSDVKSSLSSYNDAAIVTISRISGEGADLAYDGFVDGTNFLELTEEEKDLLKMANENFDNIIVLINSSAVNTSAYLQRRDKQR